MSDERGITRRSALGLGMATLASTALHDLFLSPAEILAKAPAEPSSGIAYFSRFGVDEKLIRDTLGAALGSGADYADVFIQHRVSNNYGLEDGAVNRAFKNVELGCGVRVVKGDQTGYGFTEDITVEGLKLAARTAAAIAQGPSRPAPVRFRAVRDLP